MTHALPRLGTYVDYLDHHARIQPDAEALWHGGTMLSYRALAERVDAMAGSLAAAGLQPGDRLAVLSPPRPEYLITLLAAFRLGAIWVGMNPKYTYRELAHVVGDARPRLVLSVAHVGQRELDEEIASLVSAFGVQAAYVVGDDAPTPMLRSLPPSVPFVHHPVAIDDAATIVYTSGSSGAPKGAVLSHRGLVYASLTEAQVNGVSCPRVPCNLPINHVACIADLTGTTLVAGGMLALLDSFDPVEMLDLIERLRLTNLMSVPTVLQLIALQPDFEQRDLSSLQLVAWGGAPLPIEVVRIYRRLGVQLVTVYGMTETVASITFTDRNASDEVLAETVGRLDPGMAVRLADDQEREVAVGEHGEVQVRHAGLFLQYFGQPEATAAAYTSDGWFRTGDVGMLRPDGNLQLIGRRSDMIKSGGYNVYPREIELCLESHQGVALAAVIGRADDTFGEVGIAYVQPSPGARPTPEELKAFCRKQLANYKVPKDFIIVAELPLLPVGKVDKQALRQRLVP